MIEARGKKAVSQAVLAPVEGGGAGTTERTFDCDLVVVSGGAIPASSLLLQAGAQTRYDEARGHFAVTDTPEHVAAAGEVVGAGPRDAAADSGRLAGLQAAHALGFGDVDSRYAEHALRDAIARAGDRRAPVAVAPAAIGADRGKCFACLCEDVTSKDIGIGIGEGYDSIELAKRYTTVTMGPCQGRMCQVPSVRVMAQQTGQSLGDVGTTTARPPWVSVPMGILGGPTYEPAKRSSIHGRHRELGGDVRWAGDWRRPYDYGDPQAEALAVHQAAGLIDVSTLGKLLVARPRRRRVPRPPVPQPLLEPGARPDPLRGDQLGRRADRRRRHDLPARRRVVLRDDDLERRRRGRGVVLLVAGRLGHARASDRRHPGPVGGQSCGSQGTRDHGAVTDTRLLQRGVQVPRRQARADRGSSVPGAADRLRRRGRLRDPLPGGARRASVGCVAGGGQASRAAAVRPRATADPAPAEDAHPRRPGHRLGVDAVRRGDAVDRQARQGAGLHRQVGARALRRARPRRPRWSASRWPTATCRPRARS